MKQFHSEYNDDKYRVRAAHSLGSDDIIGTSGKGGSHPYLSNVTIPGYIGAVNPDDNAWVAGVLSLSSIGFLKTISGDPTWAEGGEAIDSINEHDDSNSCFICTAKE